MRKLPAWLGPLVAGLLSAAGFAGFALLFIPRMNVYWFILSPIIIAVYQVPAVLVYGAWKRARRKPEAAEPPADGPAATE